MRKSRAFTLVEILIVVVILGILAAIVVPQFTNATQDAQAGNLKSQIKSISNQLELAKARSTDGQYPDLITDQFASFVAAGYLKAVPKNPFNGSTVVAAAPAEGNGWHYIRASGDFGACYFDEVNGVITPGTP